MSNIRFLFSRVEVLQLGLVMVLVIQKNLSQELKTLHQELILGSLEYEGDCIKPIKTSQPPHPDIPPSSYSIKSLTVSSSFMTRLCFFHFSFSFMVISQHLTGDDKSAIMGRNMIRDCAASVTAFLGI